MTEKRVVLKPGREKALLKCHPWIFSGAVASFPAFQNGETLPVHSSQGKFLAQAYFHKDNSISGRVLTFSDEPIENVLLRKLRLALELDNLFSIVKRPTATALSTQRQMAYLAL